MAKEKVLADARDLIMEKMDNEGRVLTWLAKETSIPYDTLYSCLKKKLFSLSDNNLTKINQALGTTFE
jgi:predicted transcriptional regulator